MILSKNQDQGKRQDPVVPLAVTCTAEKEVHIYEEFNKISEELGARFILSWANRDESSPWLGDWARTRQITFADWQLTLESVRQNIRVPEVNPIRGALSHLC